MNFRQLIAEHPVEHHRVRPRLVKVHGLLSGDIETLKIKNRPLAVLLNVHGVAADADARVARDHSTTFGQRVRRPGQGDQDSRVEFADAPGAAAARSHRRALTASGFRTEPGYHLLPPPRQFRRSRTGQRPPGR